MKSMGNASREYRKFAFIVSSVFALLGIVIPYMKTRELSYFSIGSVLSIIIVAVIYPILLKYPYKAWMSLGRVLGEINNFILLSLVYYVLLCPFGLLVRMLGKSKLEMQFDDKLDSYRKTRSGAITPESMERLH